MHTESEAVIEPTPWPPVMPIDLKAVFQGLATVEPKTRATAGRFRRIIAMKETAPKLVDVEPLEAGGWVDGIQASCVVGRVEHRDQICVYVAAGSVLEATLTCVHERLAAVCSSLDAPQFQGLDAQIPVVALPSVMPWQIALDISTWIDATRRHLEQLTIADAKVGTGEVLIVDGSLPPKLERSDVVGVVKRAEADYLPDLAHLPTGAGWRSPAFVLPAETVDQRDRLTAYVRLRDAGPGQEWDYSLIRVEVPADLDRSADMLDRAAALAVANKGHRGSGDPRWEIQLDPMAKAEKLLRSRVPHGIRVLQ